MAPPDRQPDSSYPDSLNLDRAFGHNGEIGAWVDWMLHPETHDHDRVYVLAAGIKEDWPYRDRAYEQDVRATTESVIEGRSISQFFDPAEALSGQSFGEGSQWHKVAGTLLDAFWQNDDNNPALLAGFAAVDWSGTAQEGAWKHLAAIDAFTKDFGNIAVEMVPVLLAYSSIIVAARRNLNEAMGQMVDAFHTKFYARENSIGPFIAAGLSVIAAAAAAAVTGPQGTIITAAAVSALVDKVAGAAFAEGNTAEAGQAGGEEWRDIVTNFFVAQSRILQNARREIAALEQKIKELQGRLATAVAAQPILFGTG